jgi:hypothetical protein
MRALIMLMVLLSSSAALARNGGIYLELAPSWGFYDTTQVVIEKDDEPGSAFPVATFVPSLKAGFNLFGWAGAEAHVTGHFWDIEADTGGAGYVGGVVRVTPLEVLTYVIPEDVEIPSLVPQGPVSWKNRPFDLGFSMGGGYTIVGEDYAYQGGYFQWGFDLKFFITPNFAMGLDFPFRHLLYEPFRYANYKNRTGYCTDGGDAYGYAGNAKFPVPDNIGEGPGQINASQIETDCEDPAPAAFFFAPALTITGVFDFGI